MQSTTVIDTLRRVPLFEDFSAGYLRRGAKQGSEKLVRGGERDGLEGEPVRSMREVAR